MQEAITDARPLAELTDAELTTSHGTALDERDRAARMAADLLADAIAWDGHETIHDDYVSRAKRYAARSADARDRALAVGVEMCNRLPRP